MTRLSASWEYLRGTYWAVPSAMATVAVGLSVAMIHLDEAATASLLDRLSWVFDEIARYGRSSVSVTCRLLEAVRSVGSCVQREADRLALLRQAAEIAGAVRESPFSEGDRERIARCLVGVERFLGDGRGAACRGQRRDRSPRGRCRERG
ncbi:MAG TPA: hypothetical protein VMN36_00685 [Verrucomicrobiales bacterium]|nr:hypothetical protein [Verrucomicrobiales bacterium]